MDTILMLLAHLGHSAQKLFLTPYTYISLLLVALVFRRQIQLQRKLFFVRIHSFLREWWKTVVWGILAGLVVSILMFASNATFEIELVPILWFTAIFLMLFRIRFVCFAYVIGVIGVLHSIFVSLELAQEWGQAQWVFEAIRQADLYSLFLLVGFLHLIESLLVRKQGGALATPMFFMSKRGKLIGGYHFQRFWPVPLLLVVPTVLGDQTIWHIWSDPELLAKVFLALLPFPVMIGFSDMTVTQLPQDKVKSTANGLLLYALIVIGLAFLVRFIPDTGVLASMLLIVLHETMRWYARRKEDKLLPLYTNSTLGLKILAVLPGSPAEKLGITAGETIHKVNGVMVHSRQQMYEAMSRNPAYCKLEVFDLEGQIRFLNRAMFAGEHHQLGIILAPDDDVLHFADYREFSIFMYLRAKLKGVLTKT
jgi:hypothetical protein